MKRHYFIFACSFFFSFGLNTMNFSLVFRLTDWFHFSPGQVGIFFALGQLFFFLGCNLYHRFGSAHEPAKVFYSAALVAFVASLPLGYIPVPFLFYGAYWILLFSTGFFWPPVMAYLTEGLSAKEMGRQLSLFNRSWMASNIIAPLLAGALYQWNSWANFLVLNICFLAVLILLRLMKRSETSVYLTHGGPEPSSPAESPPAPQDLDKRFDLYRYRGWISGLCAATCVGVLGYIFPLHIRDGLGYTESSAGLMLFLRCVASFIGFALLARFTFWHFNRRWFSILQGGMIIVFFLFLLAGSQLTLYFGIAVIFGFFHSGFYTNSIFYSSATGRHPKKNLAVHEICMAIGSAAGSAGGGFFYQNFHFAGVCLALIAFLGVGLGLMALFNRRELRYHTPKPAP